MHRGQAFGIIRKAPAKGYSFFSSLAFPSLLPGPRKAVTNKVWCGIYQRKVEAAGACLKGSCWITSTWSHLDFWFSSLQSCFPGTHWFREDSGFKLVVCWHWLTTCMKAGCVYSFPVSPSVISHGSLTLVMAGVFTPQKSASYTDEAPDPLVVKYLPALHWCKPRLVPTGETDIFSSFCTCTE